MEDYSQYKEAGKVYEYFTCVEETRIPKDIRHLFGREPSLDASYSEPLTLNESLFNSVEKKIAYLQGVIEAYPTREDYYGTKGFCLANSFNQIERCKRWIKEIALYVKIPVPMRKIETIYAIPCSNSIYFNEDFYSLIMNFFAPCRIPNSTFVK